MKTQDCELYLADPEANVTHLETCEECGLLFGGASVIESKPVAIESLPLAAWEGASEKSWSVVIVAALAVFATACAFFAAAGVAPLRGIGAAIVAMMPSLEIAQDLIFRVGGALQHVPAGWQIAVGIAFIVINALLIALLRRAPRGIDV